MKFFHRATLILALAVLPGCLVSAPFLKKDDSYTPSETVPPPVTAEQVNPANARTQAQALGDEMDRENAGASVPGPATKKSP